jgi:hypothetical protein
MARHDHFELTFVDTSGFSRARALLLIREPYPKIEYPPQAVRPQLVIQALQLMGFDPSGPGRLTWQIYPFPSGTHFAPVAIRQWGAPRPLSLEDFEAAVDLASQIGAALGASQRVALDRFKLGCADQRNDDAIVDLVIALEALLLPGFRSELSFRFALNGARTLARDRGARKLLFEEFHAIYEMRSRIVHGDEVEPAKLAEGAATARRLTAMVLRLGLDGPWPTKESLLDSALS